MFLRVDNIGAVSHAAIDIVGITVVCGQNDSGKSTLGKALWCIFNGFSRYGSQVRDARERSFTRLLRRLDYPFDYARREKQDSSAHRGIQDVVGCLMEDLHRTATDRLFVKDLVDDFMSGFPAAPVSGDDGRGEVVERVMSYAGIGDDEILARLLNNRLSSEFHQQISNVDRPEPGTIGLSVRHSSASLHIIEDAVSDYEVCNLDTHALYIDDPFVLDRSGGRYVLMRTFSEAHQEDLLRHLLPSDIPSGASGDIVESLLVDSKLEAVMNSLRSVVPGSINIQRRGDVVYSRGKGNTPLDVHNISAGMKSFAILKTLLQNGSIQEHGTVILDEPEVHLHPEWQLIYAESIVLLQKYFGLHILLNTHSPYFLHAIEVFAARHGVADRCRYYLMRRGEQGCVAQDVSANIDEIFAEMARPFMDLDELMEEED